MLGLCSDMEFDAVQSAYIEEMDLIVQAVVGTVQKRVAGPDRVDLQRTSTCDICGIQDASVAPFASTYRAHNRPWRKRRVYCLCIGTAHQQSSRQKDDAFHSHDANAN